MKFVNACFMTGSWAYLVDINFVTTTSGKDIVNFGLFYLNFKNINSSGSRGAEGAMAPLALYK